MNSIYLASNLYDDFFPTNSRSSFKYDIDTNRVKDFGGLNVNVAVKSLVFENKYNSIVNDETLPHILIIHQYFSEF